MREEYGIIDIGSNSMRLVVYQQSQIGQQKIIENVKLVARLRKYLTEDGYLSPTGITVLINTLQSFQEVVSHYHLTDIFCVATATIRQAQNQKLILKEVYKKTGLKITVLSEYEEAYYGCLAVMNAFSIEEAITIDLGGGSTEVTYFKNKEMKHYHSFPFGALSLKNQFLLENQPQDKEVDKFRLFLQEQFEPLLWLKRKKIPIIAMGGSARNIAKIHQALRDYPLSDVHQYEMNQEDINLVKEVVHHLSYEQLQKLDGLSNDRVDIIIPAVEVFDKIVEYTETPAFILSRKGLRDGFFYQQFNQGKGITGSEDVIEVSLHEIVKDFKVNLNHNTQLFRLANSFFTQMKDLKLFDFSKEDSFYLKKAASIYNFGESVDSEFGSEHTFHLLVNRMMDGMSHKQRIKLALISSYKNKALFQRFIDPYQDWFSKNEQKTMRMLGSILKLTDCLNFTKRNIVDYLILSERKNQLGIKVICSKGWQPEAYKAEKQKKHLEKLLKKEISISFQLK